MVMNGSGVRVSSPHHGTEPESVTARGRRCRYSPRVKLSLSFIPIEDEGLQKRWLLASGVRSNVSSLPAFCCVAGISSVTHEAQPSSDCVPPACSVARGSRWCPPAWDLLWVWWFLAHQGCQSCRMLRSRSEVIWAWWRKFSRGEQRSQLQVLSLCWR